MEQTKRINEDVRRELRIADMPLWALADALGVSEPTITRWMRHELSAERRQQIMDAIHEWQGMGA